MRQKLGEKIRLSVLDDRHNSPKKVSKFQNEFMKSSFLPKYEPKNCKDFCSVSHYVHYRAAILGSYFGRKDDFINSF